MTCVRKDAEQIGSIIRDIERENGEWDENNRCSRLSGPIDTQIWEQRGTIGPTIVETMLGMGVWWEKCTKNKLAATQRFMFRLRGRGEKDVPGVRFFDTCKGVIRTIPAIGTDATNSELPKDGGDDHWLDSVFYAHMYRNQRTTSDTVRQGKYYWDDELTERREQKRQRDGGRYGYGMH